MGTSGSREPLALRFVLGRHVVVHRSYNHEGAGVTRKGFQHGARKIDARGVGCGGYHNGVVWFLVVVMVSLRWLFGWQRVGSRGTKFPPALRTAKSPLAF